MMRPGFCAPRAVRKVSRPAARDARRRGEGAVLIQLDRGCGRAVRSGDSRNEGVGSHSPWSLRMCLGVVVARNACSSSPAGRRAGAHAMGLLSGGGGAERCGTVCPYKQDGGQKARQGVPPMTGRDERNQGTQARSSNHEGGRTLKKRLGVLSVVTILVMAFFALSAVASSSEMYFSTDKNGQNRVTNIQEGTEVWIVDLRPGREHRLRCAGQDSGPTSRSSIRRPAPTSSG